MSACFWFRNDFSTYTWTYDVDSLYHVVPRRWRPISHSLQQMEGDVSTFLVCSMNFLLHFYPSKMMLPDSDTIWKETNILKNASGIWTWYSKTALVHAIWSYNERSSIMNSLCKTICYRTILHVASFFFNISPWPLFEVQEPWYDQSSPC